MEQILLKISSPDKTFLDFYEPLAHNLGDRGMVYTPHPVIPPNARMAIPRPTHILVAIDSVDTFTTVYRTMGAYLARDEERELTLRKEGYSITITGSSIPGERELVNGLLQE